MMENIKGIIFDYGGTLDTNSRHWSEVLWDAYLEEKVPVTKDQFRECYVHAERELARVPYIKPEHNFLDLLRIKADIETQYLIDKGYWQTRDVTRRAVMEHIAFRCYQKVISQMEVSRPVVEGLAKRFPLVLVSNFYGNIHTILDDFRLNYFDEVIESSVVGIRKPDPRIFSLGVEAMGMKPEEIVVVGDSFSKDIIPANSIGCKTVWMKGQGWGNEEIDESVPTAILTDIALLPILFE
ncbi:MAG: HAD family hydrolase [Bacteroidaceae bacterium]|nr:HAD family hydrolase [Bacteroidaceae bacterium]